MRAGEGMKIAVVGDRLMITGFALSGVKCSRLALTVEEAEVALSGILRDPEVGVVIIQDRFGAVAHSRIHRKKDELPLFPVIVEVSGSDGPVPGRDGVQEIVHRVVGRPAGREGGKR
jgi:vacuolar-type H+-ATPase subunit F/Vma7